MAFLPVSYRGPRSGVVFIKDTTQAIVKGDVLARDTNGEVIPATNVSVAGDLLGVATESVTALQALAEVSALEYGQDDHWLADTTNNTDVADNNQRMILTNSQTVNNTGADSATGVVVQVGVVGAAADKTAIFKFVKPF